MLRFNLVRERGVWGEPNEYGSCAYVLHYPEDDCYDCKYAARRHVKSVCTFEPEDVTYYRAVREGSKAPHKWMYFGDGNGHCLAAIESRLWLEYQRWHRPKQAPGSVVPDGLRERIIDRDGYFCGICQREIENDGAIHIDHVLPFSRGGPTEDWNLRVAHQSCNQKRHNRMERYFDVRGKRWTDNIDEVTADA